MTLLLCAMMLSEVNELVQCILPAFAFSSKCIKMKSKLVDDWFAMHLMVHLSLSGTVHKIVLICTAYFHFDPKVSVQTNRVFFMFYSYQFEMVHGKLNLIRS